MPWCAHASRTSRNQRLQVVLRSLGARLRQGRDGDCRPERLRQEQRRRRHHLGDGRAERQEPARRADGGRHLQRQRCPQADRRRRSAAAVQRRPEDRQRAGVSERAGQRASNGNGQRQRPRRPRQRQRARPRTRHGPDMVGASATAIRRGRGADSVGRARSRGHPAAVPLRRERVPDRRPDLPAARRPRPADGHGARRQGLRDHRAGQDRHDPQLAADRSAPADRGSGRRHEVQGAPPRRRAEARGGAAEPHAHRRHRVRGREAARHAEAAGGQGAPLPEAARRAAALGEGAVRAQVPPARRDDRVGARHGWPTRASASRLAAARVARGREPISAACASSWSRPSRARPAPREAAHARELAHQPPAAADRVRPRAGRQRSTARMRGDRGRARRRSRRGASRRARRWRRAARRPPRPSAERDRAAAALPSESEAYEAAHREIEGLEADVEAARSEVFSAINSATALRHALEHAAAARDRVAETLSKLDVETDDVRIESRAGRGRTAAAAADGLRRAHEAIEATRIARAARESELASARIEHEWRARSVRVARARAGRPRGAPEVARGARGGARRLRRRARAPCSRRRTARSTSRARSPTTSRSRPATSARSRRASAICCSTSSSSGRSTPRPAFELVRERGAGRCGFLVTSAAGAPAAAAFDASMSVAGEARPCRRSPRTDRCPKARRAVVGRARQRPVCGRHSPGDRRRVDRRVVRRRGRREPR